MRQQTAAGPAVSAGSYRHTPAPAAPPTDYYVDDNDNGSSMLYEDRSATLPTLVVAAMVAAHPSETQPPAPSILTHTARE